MDASEDKRLRAGTRAQIQTVLEELWKIPGLKWFKIFYNYGTGEKDPNADYNPCVLNGEVIEMGEPGTQIDFCDKCGRTGKQ